MVYAYEVTVRPGAIKGWIRHESYDDRLFHSAGSIRWVLYDERPRFEDRWTRSSELFFDEHHRSLLLIPRGVWHAIQNVGCRRRPHDQFPDRPVPVRESGQDPFAARHRLRSRTRSGAEPPCAGRLTSVLSSSGSCARPECPSVGRQRVSRCPPLGQHRHRYLQLVRGAASGDSSPSSAQTYPHVGS